MHILVAGGAGYIGSHVVMDLLEHGHRVTVFDDLSTGREENLQEGAAFVKGDIFEKGVLERLMRATEFDAIVHLAALKAAGDSMNEPERYTRHNIEGSYRLLELAVQFDVRFFVFSSTATVYGDPQYLPMDEKHPLNPTSFYGFTKLQVERQMAWCSQLRGLRFASLRYFNAAGYDASGRAPGRERGTQNLIPLVMEFASGRRSKLEVYGDDYETRDGTCIRDYIHVHDLAAAHTKALNWLETHDKDLIVNLGSEKGYTVKEVLAAAEKVIGKSLDVSIVGRRPGDAPSLLADAALARRLLDWTPQQSDLHHMLATTWELYRPR